MKQLPSPLLVITDRHQARHSIAAIAEEVGQGGGRWLLLRDKDLEPQPRRDLAAHLAEIARRDGIGINTALARKRYAVLQLRKKLAPFQERYFTD